MYMPVSRWFFFLLSRFFSLFLHQIKFLLHWIIHVQVIHFTPAPVDRTSASAWSYKHPWIKCQKPSTPMTNVACESKLLSVLRSSMHTWQENCVAIGRVVVYYARHAHAFSAGIKCWHCGVAPRVDRTLFGGRFMYTHMVKLWSKK